MKYRQGQLDSLYDQLDSAEVLENLGVRISQTSGKELICHCPYTDNHSNGDANPSFCFNIEKKKGVCFVCGPINLLRLTQDLLQIDPVEAERWLREQTMPIIDSSKLEERVQRIMAPTPIEQTETEYPPENLFQYRSIHSYLYERGLTKDIIIKMQVGYDDEHDAIVIPHFFMGKLKGWQWRHLSPDCDRCGNSAPKYKNTSGFQKKNTLYNYDNAMQAMRDTGEKMILVESPMSALKILSAGIETVVATFGSWSNEQILSLAGCQAGLIMWPDNDGAGNASFKRTLTFASKLVPLSIAPLVPTLKGDPGDLDYEQIKDYLANTYPPAYVIKYKKLLTKEDIDGINN